jgi:colicin import membrane protein
MQLGLVISLLIHSGILAWAYLVMLSTPKLEPPDPEPITVALITPSELLRLKQGSETSKELEAKAKSELKPTVSVEEAEKPKPVSAPTPPEEPAPPKEEAKPSVPAPEPPKADPIAEKLAALPAEPPAGPTPEEMRKREEEKRAAEEKRKAEEEKRKAEQKKKAEELKKRLAERKKKEEEKKKAEAKQKSAADRLAALLDKDPTKKGAPQTATEPTTDTSYTGPTAGAREGTDSVLSVREQDILKGQISAQLRGCWKLPGGGGGIETTVVTIKWHLNLDGSLDGEPTVEQTMTGPVFQIAAEAAIRAVKTCAPFTLPPDKYAAWKTITWDFDPRDML